MVISSPPTKAAISLNGLPMTERKISAQLGSARIVVAKNIESLTFRSARVAP